MSNKKSKIVCQDKTETSEKSLASKKLQARVAAMSPEDKAAFAAELSLPVRKIPVPKERVPTKTDKFNEANGRLTEQIASIHTILDGCEFEGGFALTIGCDAKGNKVHSCKQVRAQYAPRKGAESDASA